MGKDIRIEFGRGGSRGTYDRFRNNDRNGP